ncbi:MAG: sigma-54 dependent transcriptional regulator [bacterium]|nr:sigma-54 dependent transcriptional regulator [bacterium]
MRIPGLIGSTETMGEVLRLVEKAAAGNFAVLIEGETGTGKELLARAIHTSGPRRRAAFVPQNCAAMPESLLESELFGHVRGAFTDATVSRQGLLAAANGGTIFLDEIAESSPRVQVKLLRFLQDGVIRPLGSVREIRLDVRVISATNHSLQEEVARGGFRRDLFYRLNVFPIRVPPLRDRRRDIPLLAAHFLRLYARRAGARIDGFTAETMRLLEAYPFPGNVRELQNEIERIVAMHREGNLVRPDELSKRFTAPRRAAGRSGSRSWRWSARSSARRSATAAATSRGRRCGWASAATASTRRSPATGSGDRRPPPRPCSHCRPRIRCTNPPRIATDSCRQVEQEKMKRFQPSFYPR